MRLYAPLFHKKRREETQPEDHLSVTGRVRHLTQEEEGREKSVIPSLPSKLALELLGKTHLSTGPPGTPNHIGKKWR